MIEQVELDRGGAGGDGGVDAVGVGLEDHAGVVGLVFPLAGGVAAEAEGAVEFVDAQQALVEQRGGASVGHVAVELELPAAILAEAEALGEEGVAGGLGFGVGDAPAVADDADGGVEVFSLQFAVDLRKGSLLSHADAPMSIFADR